MTSTGRSVLNLSSDSSSLSQRMSQGMSDQMTKIKNMDYKELLWKGFWFVLALGILAYIGSWMYYDTMNRKTMMNRKSDPNTMMMQQPQPMDSGMYSQQNEENSGY
jgi:hypothetical protein